MAFVAQSERRISQISRTVCPLGPGQYFQSEPTSPKKQCAPFQSTSRRRTFLEPSNAIKPGPGNYEVSKPFIEPNIKTISNSQSIIVKINSTGTAQFKSVVDRFGNRVEQLPGPGQYSFDDKDTPRRKSTSQRSIHENKIIDKLKQLNNKKNYPTIPERTRGLTDTKKEEINPEGKLGPAFYNPRKFQHLNSTSAVWGKDRTKRFSVDNKSEVGPGKYNLSYNAVKLEEKFDQTSAQFKSNTVRTYFDSLIYKTNVDETAKLRDVSHFKVKDPAPGQYEVNKSSIKVQEKPFALQFFGSTVERFPEQHIPQRKTKSFYNIRSDIGKNNSFNKSEHAFLSDTLRKAEFLKINEKQKLPGPGQYRQNVKVEKKLKGNRIEKFGSNTKRMFQIEEPVIDVGPGKYTPDEAKVQTSKNSRFGQIKQISSNFRSTTSRDCFGNTNNVSIPFAEYDVSQYDLAKKLEKQKNFIENLKKIDVEKAPFQSSISRFPHYQDRPKNDRKLSLEENRALELKIRQEQQKQRQMVLQANQAQVREVKKNYFGGSQRFKLTKKSAPPVGQYSLKTNWQTKSHNIKFTGK